MSQRNVKRPKVQCPECGLWLRRLDQHKVQKHRAEPSLAESIAAGMGLFAVANAIAGRPYR